MDLASTTHEKICSSCGHLKSSTSFYKKERGLYGLDSKCKDCVLLCKSKNYQRLKQAKKGIINLIDSPSGQVPEHAVALMLKHLGVR